MIRGIARISPFSITCKSCDFDLTRQILMAALKENQRDCPTSPKKRRISDSRNNGMADGSVLRFHKLSEYAREPTRGSEYAAGLDLYSAKDETVPAQGKKCVMTDIQIEIPLGCYGRVAPRSGLAAKHHIDVGAGVIDPDYRGNVGVVMFNLGSEPFHVKVGDRIAQLVLEKIFMPRVEESTTKLPDTVRGAGGFGSTGGFQKNGVNGHALNGTSNGALAQNGTSNGAHAQNGTSNGAHASDGSGDAGLTRKEDKIES